MQIYVALQPVVALIAGILILIIPRLLNYIVALYLIVTGCRISRVIERIAINFQTREADNVKLGCYFSCRCLDSRCSGPYRSCRRSHTNRVDSVCDFSNSLRGRSRDGAASLALNSDHAA
jgi:hypothetical protein